MNLQSFPADIKIVVMNTAVSAGTTTVTPAAPVDMQGFDSVAFLVLTGDVTATSVITVTANEVASNTNAGGTAITASAAAFTAGASDADTKAIISELIRPTTRYVYPTVARATANAALNGIVAFLFNADKVPVTQSDLIAWASAPRN